MIIASTATTVHVSDGSKLLAVLIGLGVLALLWLIVGILGGGSNPLSLVKGADGLSSTSKFQWGVWLVVIIFAYVTLWVVRARAGDYSAISDVPTNLLTVLGFSTGTMVAAKGITVGYTGAGRLAKPGTATAQPTTGGLLKDDDGVPELAKIQMIAFTIIAVGIFLATLIHQLRATNVNTDLPDIDDSLLVLMGLSQGGYLGKKLVTFGSPTLYGPTPNRAAPGARVTVTGAALGDTQGGSQLLLDDIPINVQPPWSSTVLTFVIPANHPSGAAWATPQDVQLTALVNGQTSNSVTLTIA